MKQMTTDEIKKCELGILRFVHQFCEKNNIKYCLTFGSLLGAIRHNGFIPWDDDIDVFMPRQDYEKFVSLFESNKYTCYSVNKQKHYPYSYAKVVDCRTIKKEPIRINKKVVLGVDIDVFPLDYFYEQHYDKKIIKKWKNRCRLWYLSVSMFKDKNAIRTILFFPLKVLLHPFSNAIARSINHLVNYSQSINKKPMGYISAYCTSEKIRLYNLEWFADLELHSFENDSFLIPSNYEMILKSIYGDYMKLPPKEKQITHHNSNCFYKD